MPCSGPLQAIKGLARQIQGALPVVGLLSRLSSPSGGIGSDILVSNQHITQPCMTDIPCAITSNVRGTNGATTNTK